MKLSNPLPSEDEMLKALSRFNQLTVEARAELVVYLQFHEDDIAYKENDFEELRLTFKQLFIRDPGKTS